MKKKAALQTGGPKATERPGQTGGVENPITPPFKTCLFCLPGLGAWFFAQLAVFGVLLTLIGYLTLPRLAGRSRLLSHALLVAAALGSSVGLVRFAAAEALPGIVQARSVAAERQAVSFLRELVRAQDSMRKSALIDPDRDGVGSAGLLVELCGVKPPRGRAHDVQPILHARYRKTVNTKTGLAARIGGYLYQLCLPLKGGGFTTVDSELIDDEAAERTFVGYAWPASTGESVRSVFFIDQHERILTYENGKQNGPMRYAGPANAPQCNAALSSEAGVGFRVWQGKKPRTELPGDKR